MIQGKQKHSVLILGASGYLGNAIYKELAPFFKTFGTYNTPKKAHETNAHFFQYNVEEDSIYDILEACKPSIIITALRGNFSAQTKAHTHCIEYALAHNSKIIFLSSANVFDAYSKYPSYETDKTLSHSIYGHFKIKIENMLLRIPKKQMAIIRLPMVFGSNCPRLQEIKFQINANAPVEVFPNLIMNVAFEKNVTQHIHYIINRNKNGIFHSGSTDLVLHEDFTKSIIKGITSKKILLKQVFTTNEDRYLAVLPKYNLLPKHLQINTETILKEIQKIT